MLLAMSELYLWKLYSMVLVRKTFVSPPGTSQAGISPVQLFSRQSAIQSRWHNFEETEINMQVEE